MTVTDLHAALTTIKDALPALGVLADADAHRAERDASAQALRGQVAALESLKAELTAQIADETKAAEVKRQALARDHTAALNVGEEKIRDLQRSQQAAEKNLATLLARGMRVIQEQEAEQAKQVTEHTLRLAGLVKQEQAARAQLAATQAKIKAIHGGLAEIGAP